MNQHLVESNKSIISLVMAAMVANVLVGNTAITSQSISDGIFAVMVIVVIYLIYSTVCDDLYKLSVQVRSATKRLGNWKNHRKKFFRMEKHLTTLKLIRRMEALVKKVDNCLGHINSLPSQQRSKSKALRRKRRKKWTSLSKSSSAKVSGRTEDGHSSCATCINCKTLKTVIEAETSIDDYNRTPLRGVMKIEKSAIEDSFKSSPKGVVKTGSSIGEANLTSPQGAIKTVSYTSGRDLSYSKDVIETENSQNESHNSRYRATPAADDDSLFDSQYNTGTSVSNTETSEMNSLALAGTSLGWSSLDDSLRISSIQTVQERASITHDPNIVKHSGGEVPNVPDNMGSVLQGDKCYLKFSGELQSDFTASDRSGSKSETTGKIMDHYMQYKNTDTKGHKGNIKDNISTGVNDGVEVFPNKTKAKRPNTLIKGKPAEGSVNDQRLVHNEYVKLGSSSFSQDDSSSFDGRNETIPKYASNDPVTPVREVTALDNLESVNSNIGDENVHGKEKVSMSHSDHINLVEQVVSASGRNQYNDDEVKVEPYSHQGRDYVDIGDNIGCDIEEDGDSSDIEEGIVNLGRTYKSELNRDIHRNATSQKGIPAYCDSWDCIAAHQEPSIGYGTARDGIVYSTGIQNRNIHSWLYGKVLTEDDIRNDHYLSRRESLNLVENSGYSQTSSLEMWFPDNDLQNHGCLFEKDNDLSEKFPNASEHEDIVDGPNNVGMVQEHFSLGYHMDDNEDLETDGEPVHSETREVPHANNIQEFHTKFGIDLRLDDPHITSPKDIAIDGIDLASCDSEQQYNWTNLSPEEYDYYADDMGDTELWRPSNRPIYDQLKQIDWVMGYFSSGDSIAVFVDLDGAAPDFFLEQLCQITNQPASKFHVKDNMHQWSL